MDQLHAHLAALEPQVHTLHQQAHAVDRRLRWWRRLACGLGVLGLIGWALQAGPAADAQLLSLPDRLAALEGKLAKLTFHAATNEVVITGATPPAGRGVPKITWVMDFADYAGGSLEEWLHTKGFRLEHGAEDPASLALSHKAGALVLEAKQPVRGFLVNDQVKLAHFSTIHITWGIIKYPTGASYERNINNEALMLYISFGQDEVPSGHVLIPARPYFIGLFLGQEETLNMPYQGKYFREGGRFVCIGHPQPYDTVRSEFDLRTAFQTYFDKADVPMISAISLGVDTFASGEGGTAAAYIHRIEVLE